MMIKFLKSFVSKKAAQNGAIKDRQQLEEKAVRGARKAVTEYRRVFDRLAEYDRV